MRGSVHVSEEELAGWFAGRLPAGWFSEPELASDAAPEAVGAARTARIDGFREDTRGQRMRIADEAQGRFGRRVSWGARCGDLTRLFTTVSVPAMTRLRMPERRVLDTLVDPGVPRARSHALAWCVRLVSEKQDDWLKDLRQALTEVEKVRSEGPKT